MKVGVFVPPNDRRHILALRAFATGVGMAGDSAVTYPLEKYQDCDVAVVFGMYKSRIQVSWARGKIFNTQRERDRPVVVIDSGYVKRDKYYMVGLNGLNGRADFCNGGVPTDRWDALGVELKPWRKSGSHIVVAGQIPWDASCQHVNNTSFCQSLVANIQKLTKRKVRFRPHPLIGSAFDYGVARFGAEVSERPLVDDLRDAHALCTFNSNTSVEAVIEGVPIFVFDKGAMLLSIAETDIQNIERPMTPERIPALSRLAYAQWTLEEMADGVAWQHLRPEIERQLEK